MNQPDNQPASDQKQLLYFADPMCSWCWGFSPVIMALVETHGDRLPIRPIMGGLRPGTEKPMDQGDKDEIRKHWEHVRDGTGQPFDFAFFERDDFVYDTEPPSRAVVTARALAPGQGLALLAALQHAFYAENRDITDTQVVVGLAEEQGFDAEDFASTFASETAKRVTEADFHIAHRLGIRGFPTLLAGTEEKGFALVTHGYQPLEALAGPIAEWLES